MIIEPARRTSDVKEYYFAGKNAQIAQLNMDKTRPEIINLGIGAPDRRPPQAALDKMCEITQLDTSHKYQSYKGQPELRKAFSDWYSRYYGVALDPACEIQPLTGSKEGILISSLAFLNEGDGVLVPNPGYPTYTSAAKLAGARIVEYDLLEENGFYPDFDQLESMDLSGVKMMWVNYPNMPTGAPASREVYEKIVAFGRRHGILVCNDNPYSFVLTDERLSILSVEGSRGCCIELNSLSKAHNMSGWRIGMVAGDAEIIRELLKVKSQMDSGMYLGLQKAAVEALSQGEEWFTELNATYRERQKAAAEIMDLLNLHYNPSSTGLFLWGRMPEDAAMSASDMSDKLLEEARVFITPGFIFGSNGEKYLRISLCATVDKLHEAKERIKAVL